MRCSFSVGEDLSNFSHGTYQRRNGVVGCDQQCAHTVMESAGSAEPHIVQVFLTSHCKQIKHIILRCLYCSLPASPSYPTLRNTRAHTQTPFMQAVQKVQTVCMYTGDQVLFYAFHCLFSIESFKINLDSTTSK